MAGLRGSRGKASWCSAIQTTRSRQLASSCKMHSSCRWQPPRCILRRARGRKAKYAPRLRFMRKKHMSFISPRLRFSYSTFCRNETSTSESEERMEPMIAPTLLVLAAGMGSRYGGLKQIDPVGPDGETMMDYSIFDARRAGFDKVVFVIRRDIEEPFKRSIGA